MVDREKNTFAPYEKAKTNAADWEQKFLLLKQSSEKDIKALEGTITAGEGQRATLEKRTIDHCRKILGKQILSL